MELVIDKCALMYVKKGLIVESEGVMLSDSTKLRSLFATIIYLYLGFSQSLGLPESAMKQTFRKSFFGSLKNT